MFRYPAARRAWTAADYESQEIFHQLGRSDAAARVARARRAHPVRHAVRTLRSRLALHRQGPQHYGDVVDRDAARAAAEAVNRGDIAAADRIVAATADARSTAFTAFRYIDIAD